MKKANVSSADMMKAVALIVVAALCWLFFPPLSNENANYIIEIGKPWPYDRVSAEFDFPIYKTEEDVAKEQAQLLASFTPCYNIISEQNEQLIISAYELEQLHEAAYSNIAILNADHTLRLVPLKSLFTPKSYYVQFHEERIPNLQYDSLTSAKLKQTLLAGLSTTQGLVQTGEKIIDRGEIVTPHIHQMLLSLDRANMDRNIDSHHLLFIRIFYAVMLILILACFAIFLMVFRKQFWELKYVIFFSITLCIIVLMTYILLARGRTLVIYAVPFAWTAIIVRVFCDSRTAFMFHFTTCLIASLAAPSPFMFFFIQIGVGIIAVATLWDISQRGQLAKTAGWVLLTYAVSYTTFILATTGNVEMLDWKIYLMLLVNAVLIICSYGVIYLFEKLFRMVSNITLVELTNVNSDLMHRFAEEAPGTFQHSLQVSNLATAAAKSIDANVLLVRTGALYHDIGKLKNPLNFTENQGGGHNPLLELSNAEAAKAVIGHVAEGVNIAREHHLPEVIIQLVQTHHGTGLTRYFYNSEVNRIGAENVDKAMFTYPGPRPQTKEGTILMMADAIEARSRSLKEYTEVSISEMVDDMINSQIAAGQFNETKLSFRDVETLRRVFKERLMLIFHHRIQYPTINPAQ
ncbi:MAG: HDIG domain-containing protein [Paludibacteraceae bacterium]|nr:HDIG domain-containing protein [Paludibacteraceae bacterium]